jgi:signal transduction histidine kinase
MGELNENILNSIDSVLIVSDLAGNITQCNPGALRWLETTEAQIKGSSITVWSKLQSLLEEVPGGEENWLERLQQTSESWKLGPLSVCGRVYGGHVMPLRQELGDAHGAILVLDDLTDEVDLQDRLRRAENLAAVGRMSAQVAHEVRNPLHSIGLEAEMAVELASRLGHFELKQALQSILGSVDRLQKITENYLKLSRLSDGQRSVIDLGDILESVLATYSTVCEVQGVRMDWKHEENSCLKTWADRDLLEQVLGNLLRNSLQALEDWKPFPKFQPCITWSLGNTPFKDKKDGFIWLRIEDNGPGIAIEVKDRLFTPFVTTRAQGTGLGLSFIKKVLEEHGGQIQSRDRTGNLQGACFELCLPQLEGLAEVNYPKLVEGVMHV